MNLLWQKVLFALGLGLGDDGRYGSMKTFPKKLSSLLIVHGNFVELHDRLLFDNLILFSPLFLCLMVC
jgi:hypothetical protein